MTRDLSWTLGKIGLDARKLLVFAVLGLLAAGLVVSSGPTPHVYAAHFTSATETKLTASDAGPADSFGFIVSIDGDTAVVGAWLDDDVAIDSGAAYVFVRDLSGNWSQQAKLKASDAATNDAFGFRGVSVNGDTVVIGAHANNDACPTFLECNSGAAYVFVRPAGGWSDATEDAKLTASDAEKFDSFGVSVSVSGETVVVGAFLDDDAGSNSGSAYVFVRPAGGWLGDLTEDAKMTASDAALGDQFGFSVSVSGETVAVGARGNDDAGSDSGSAYVFERPGGGWTGDLTEDAKLTASDAAAGDGFGGGFVSVSGDTLVVGSPGDDDGGLQSGSAYVYAASPPPDDDGDDVLNASDNCPNTPAGESVDGVFNNADLFPNSDLGPSVVIGACDSGAANQLLSNGATFNDLVAQAAAQASNHGEFVSAVTDLGNGWKRAGLISGREKGKITSYAARSDIP